MFWQILPPPAGNFCHYPLAEITQKIDLPEPKEKYFQCSGSCIAQNTYNSRSLIPKKATIEPKTQDKNP